MGNDLLPELDGLIGGGGQDDKIETAAFIKSLDVIGDDAGLGVFIPEKLIETGREDGKVLADPPVMAIV